MIAQVNSSRLAVEDGQANTIDGNRTFLDEVTAQFRRDGKGVQERVAFRLNTFDRAHTIDMAGDDVPGESITHS